MPAVRKVLVIGSGLAGLSAAILAARQGIEVEVAEVSPELRPLGSGISVNGPSVRALRMLDEDVLRRCLAGAGLHHKLTFATAEGQVVRRVDLPSAAGPGYPGGFGILRSVLWDVLARAAREAGATIRLAVSPTAIEQDAGQVQVTLSDGSQIACDLLVGADGVWSKVRELAFPHAPAPSFTGQTAWRVVVPRHPEVSEGVIIFIGPRGRMGASPVSPDEMYVFVLENTAEPSRLAQQEWPATLRELLSYQGVIAWAREHVADPARIDRRPLHALLLPLPWHAGRVLLIGDAAHAPTPHLALGAGIAVEDAVVLGELLGSRDDLAGLLAEYGERRWERCRLVVENSLQLGAWDKNPGTPGADPAGLSDASFAAMAAPF